MRSLLTLLLHSAILEVTQAYICYKPITMAISPMIFGTAQVDTYEDCEALCSGRQECVGFGPAPPRNGHIHCKLYVDKISKNVCPEPLTVYKKGECEESTTEEPLVPTTTTERVPPKFAGQISILVAPSPKKAIPVYTGASFASIDYQDVHEISIMVLSGCSIEIIQVASDHHVTLAAGQKSVTKSFNVAGIKQVTANC